MRERLGRRIGADGDLRVTASNRRSQLQNREAARARLVELLDEALAVDPPRVPTRQSRSAQNAARRDREHAQRRKAERTWRPRPDD